MMWYGGFGGMGAWGGFWMVLEALLWVGLLALVVWGLIGLLPSRTGSGEETAREILRRRYARGEISAAEYEQATRALGWGGPGTDVTGKA